jgi:putative transposase
MTDAIGAEKGERSPGRLGYRSGYYSRALVARVGKLELRIPQDRQGYFPTQIFERYQRSEKALVSALAEWSWWSRMITRDSNAPLLK